MNRKRSMQIFAILFLVQSAVHSQDLLTGTFQVNSHLNVSLIKSKIPELTFFQRYDILCMAMLIYKLDAVERYSKDVVKETMMRDYDRVFLNFLGVRFDLENIDIGKKGWTRYYPFSIHGIHYIIRIFRTEERAFQPGVQVLYEAVMDDSRVTVQIIPGVNAILKKCDIKPITDWDTASAGTSL